MTSSDHPYAGHRTEHNCHLYIQTYALVAYHSKSSDYIYVRLLHGPEQIVRKDLKYQSTVNIYYTEAEPQYMGTHLQLSVVDILDPS